MLTTFYVGGPLHLRVPIFALESARQHREHGMAGTITPICLCDEPLLIRASCATYRAYLARVGWGQNGGGVAHSAFLEGFPPQGHIQEGIVQFIAARQVASHPVAVSRWEKRRCF